MCVRVCVRAREDGGRGRGREIRLGLVQAREGVRSLGAVVTDTSELPMVLGTKYSSLEEQVANVLSTEPRL